MRVECISHDIHTRARGTARTPYANARTHWHTRARNQAPTKAQAVASAGQKTAQNLVVITQSRMNPEEGKENEGSTVSKAGSTSLKCSVCALARSIDDLDQQALNCGNLLCTGCLRDDGDASY